MAAVSSVRPADLLVGAAHALVAVAATGAVAVLLDDHGSGTDLLRATGVTALLWSWAGLLIGLLLGIRLPRPIRARRAAWTTVHRQVNLAALALVVVHAVSFVVAPGGSLLVALVPQTAPVGPLAYSAGVVALYLAVVLGPSYYLRHRIGRRTWLVAHQFAAVTYALALWHTLVLGSDARADGPPRTLLWMLQVPVLALFVVRFARPLRPAVGTGILLAALGVLYVALAALQQGRS